VVHDRIAADPTTPLRRPSLAAPGGRPAVDLMGEVTAALESREPLYRECADVVIDTSAEPPDAVARRIVEWLADHWPQGPSTEGRMR
jgi:shikimate kinase